MVRFALSALLVAVLGSTSARTARAADSLAQSPPAPPTATAAAAEQTAAEQLAAADRDTVFRYDPFLAKDVAVGPAEIKPGFLYNHYHPQLKQRVWSIAVEGGGFQYAMAPGSTQPARALDLRATSQQLREALIAKAPELAKIMEVRGGVAHVRLKQDQTWELVKAQTIANVFDLETGRRWEWHGARRVAVVHTAGYEWEFVDGEPIPATYLMMGSATGCW